MKIFVLGLLVCLVNSQDVPLPAYNIPNFYQQPMVAGQPLLPGAASRYQMPAVNGYHQPAYNGYPNLAATGYQLPAVTGYHKPYPVNTALLASLIASLANTFQNAQMLPHANVVSNAQLATLANSGLLNQIPYQANAVPNAQMHTKDKSDSSSSVQNTQSNWGRTGKQLIPKGECEFLLSFSNIVEGQCEERCRLTGDPVEVVCDFCDECFINNRSQIECICAEFNSGRSGKQSHSKERCRRELKSSSIVSRACRRRCTKSGNPLEAFCDFCGECDVHGNNGIQCFCEE